MKTSTLFLKLQILLLGLFIQTIQAQDSSPLQKIKHFQQNFSEFSKNYPQEKVYLHIDNTAYYLGETIWFKAYVVQADHNSLSQLSKILYVELINAEGYIVETEKLKIENGQCHGNFKPITSSYTGFYEIRAYTNYMLNFGSKNYFSRVFPVYDKPKAAGEYVPQITDRPNSQVVPQIRSLYEQKGSLSMSFYPEGGNLVTGVSSKVAFKATAKNGENAYVAGAIYNEKDENIIDFATEHLGMGSFKFIPGSEKYYAKVRFDKKEYKFELPAALSKGYTMTIDNTAVDKITIIIQKNASTVNEPLGLCVASRGVLYDFEEINLNTKNLQLLTVAKKKLPSGVSQITLYNANGEVMSERLAFVNHHSQMTTHLSQNKTTYQPFEKVDMTFRFGDIQDNPVQTTFSVSVRDASTSSVNPLNDNILSNLLLSSEVVGYIENPDYYFQAEDDTHQNALDLLLLTQGWSRYSWKQMAGESTFTVKYPIEKELIIDGSVYSLVLKNKMKDVDISMLLSTDSLSQYGKCKTDLNGKFGFILKDFYGDAKLTIQSKIKDKRKEMYIELNRNFSPPYKTYTYAELHVPQYYNTTLDKIMVAETGNRNDSIKEKDIPKDNEKLAMNKKVFLLKEVTVKEKRKPIKISIRYDVANELDKRRDKGDWIPTNVNTFLHFTCDYYNASTGTYKGKYVLFVLEQFTSEVNVDETNTNTSETELVPGLGNNLSGGEMPYLDQVESISFIEDYASIYRIYNGIIDPSSYVIALIQPKTNYKREPYGIRNTTFPGYSYVREFYSPEYSKTILPDEKDYRRTLYWNPNVKTDTEGNATISFYNNSSCKTMNVNAETVTENGMIGIISK